MALFDKRPFAWKDGEETRGFHYAIAKGLSERMGRPLKIELVPVRRAIEMLRHGEVDLIFMTDQISLSEMRTQKAFMLDVGAYIYTLADHKPIANSKDLKGKVGRLAGGCSEFADLPDIQWSDMKSFDQCIDVLLLGRVDSVCSSIGLQYLMNTRRIPKTKVKSYLLQSKSLWAHALPTMDKKKWKEIETAVDSLVKDGSIAKWSEEEGRR